MKMKKTLAALLALSILALTGACGPPRASGLPAGYYPCYYAEEELLLDPDYNDDFNTEEYNAITENSFKAVSTSPLSTFAADVDTASYANIRRMINSGQMPAPDAVRIEEMLNYFTYDYPQPDNKDPFSVTTEIAD